MRILQVIDSATVGGAEENTALLSLELARRGHRVRLASPEGPFTSRFDALEGVEALRLPLRASLREARGALDRELREHPADVVHSHMLRADAVVALQGRAVPFARITSIHNMFHREVPSPWRRAAYRVLAAWAYRRFDAVLPVSHHVAGYLKEYLGVGGSKVGVVPNGIDAQAFRARAHDNARVPSTPRRVLLTVGRLDENKGQELVVQAVASFPPLLRDNLEVWLAGTGPREREVKKLAEQLGVTLRPLGRRDDVPALMQRADVVVQPSRWEALPNTVLEALALARPVVATAAGGTGEAVEDGKTGWLVAPSDPVALAGALEAALTDLEEAARRGRAGRQRVDERFTIGRAVDLLLSHPALAGPASGHGAPSGV